MDLQWQIKIVEQMIRENPENTIKDYNLLLAEVQLVELSIKKEALTKEINEIEQILDVLDKDGSNQTISKPSPGNV